MVDSKCIENELINEMNRLSLIGGEDTWTLSETQLHRPKLISNGYAYIIDKKCKKIYWKCEDKNCKGRGISNINMQPPLTVSQCHDLWHEPVLEKREVVETIKQFKLAAASKKGKTTRTIIKQVIKDKSDEVLAQLPTASALTQQSRRPDKKNKQAAPKEPKYLKDLVINEQFKKTYKGEDFLLGEGGKENERVFLFSTHKNLRMLSKHTSWMGDGTFAVLPIIFLQLYTILVLVNNFPLPLAYGLLPNKQTKTYVIFFNLIKNLVTCFPKSFNVDFELATFNAVKSVFGDLVQIYGCYFHLSQSFFRNVQLKGLLNDYRYDKNFRKCFNLSQALAFLPPEDVQAGFLLLRNHAKSSCKSFLVMLDYIEIYYIGKKNAPARFEIKTWNVRERALLGLPRTSNKLERFNKEFNSDSGDYHQATHDIIENLRLEQGNTELTIVRIRMGEEKPKNKLQANLDDALEDVLKEYNNNEIFLFLTNVSVVIEKHRVIINKSKGKKPAKLNEDED